MRFTGEPQVGKVRGIYLPAGEEGARYLVNQEVEETVLTPEGVIGDRHATFTMPADSRTTNLYPKGTVIRNNRQWTAISPADLQKISKNLGAQVEAGMIGMNLLIDGIERFSEILRGSYLILFAGEASLPCSGNDVVLVVHGQVLPCTISGKALAVVHKRPDLEKRFPKASIGFRGISGWIEKGGIIRPGNVVWLLTPTGAD